MTHQRFKAGDAVPAEGVYRVHHYQHRIPHLVRTRLLSFPPCDRCGNKVQFETVLILESCPLPGWLIDDADFATADRTRRVGA